MVERAEDNEERIAEAEADQEQIEGLPEMPDTMPEATDDLEPLPPSRLELLTEAIARRPNAPANYVLRGELLLDGGDDDLAAEDFEKAIELANSLAQTADWGYINVAYVDRAHEGLRRVGRW